MKLQILKLLICLFASTFFLFNCSKKQCIDKTEPIIYFTQKSLWSGEDTSMVQNIRMIAADKTVILGYEDQSNHKIRLAQLVDQTDVFFQYRSPNDTLFDKISLIYQRERTYTGSECGFAINVKNITIKSTELHSAKNVSINSLQQLQLSY